MDPEEFKRLVISTLDRYEKALISAANQNPEGRI